MGGGFCVNVGLGVGVKVAVGVIVAVGVDVGVAVTVEVGVGVGVGVGSRMFRCSSTKATPPLLLRTASRSVTGPFGRSEISQLINRSGCLYGEPL